MTTVHGYDTLPPVSPEETSLELTEDSIGNYFEVQSEHLEAIAYFAGGGWFYGLHEENRPGAWSLRVSIEEQDMLMHGTGSGTKPLKEVGAADLTLQEQKCLKQTLATKLLQLNHLHHLAGVQVERHAFFSHVTEGVESGILLPPNEHGYIDLSVLRDKR